MKKFKKLTKRTLAMLVSVIITVCTLGTGAFAAEPTTVSLDYTAAQGVDKTNPDTDITDYHMLMSKVEEKMVYFQYDLSQIPENAVITDVIFQTFYSNTGGSTAVYTFDCETALTATTYNQLVASGYTDATRKLIVQKATASGFTYDQATPTNDSSAGKKDRLTIDVDELTASVKAAHEAGKKYYNMVFVGAGNNYAKLQFTNRSTYKPGQQLVIKYAKAPKVEITGASEGVFSVNQNTGFNVAATVEKGDADLVSVVLSVKDESNGDVQTYTNPVIDGSAYTWNFSAGLLTGTYTATVTATDADGYTSEDIVTINIKGPKTVYIPAHMIASGGSSQYNFQIPSGANTYGYLQYDLGSYVEEGTEITDAKWYFGNVTDYYSNHAGKLCFKKITTQTKNEAWFSYDMQLPAGLTLAESEFLVTENSVKDLYAQETKPTITNGAQTTTNTEAYFVTVPMKDAVVSAWEADEKYFGFGVRLNTGNVLTVAKSGGYIPMLQVTYEEKEEQEVEAVVNHTLSVADGTATANVDVNQGPAVLIIAAYGTNNTLLSCVVEDNIIDNKLSATLTNASAVSFKSFVWDSIDTLNPLVSAK
ncbi:MAG: hypothetical protein J6D26_05060 [Clostridia bacterium]|nr:hypothetical protein [Clostridia bacterium]